MLVCSFNLSQSFNYAPYLFYAKQFKSEISSFCIWTLFVCVYQLMKSELGGGGVRWGGFCLSLCYRGDSFLCVHDNLTSKSTSNRHPMSHRENLFSITLPFSLCTLLADPQIQGRRNGRRGVPTPGAPTTMRWTPCTSFFHTNPRSSYITLNTIFSWNTAVVQYNYQP